MLLSGVGGGGGGGDARVSRKQINWPDGTRDVWRLVYWLALVIHADFGCPRSLLRFKRCVTHTVRVTNLVARTPFDANANFSIMAKFDVRLRTREARSRRENKREVYFRKQIDDGRFMRSPNATGGARIPGEIDFDGTFYNYFWELTRRQSSWLAPSLVEHQ